MPQCLKCGKASRGKYCGKVCQGSAGGQKLKRRFHTIDQSKQRETVFALYRDYGSTEIGKILGCSKQNVLKILRRLKVKMRPGGPLRWKVWQNASEIVAGIERGETLTSFARKYDTSLQTISNIVKRFSSGNSAGDNNKTK